MLIVYDSMTGNVQRFINKLQGFNCIKILSGLQVDEPYILVTFTTGFGEIPKSTQEFLNLNGGHIKAVVSSGNMNWGNNYANAADLISQEYHVPILMKFELSGLDRDVKKFTMEVERIVKMDNPQQ